ncbi:MAG: tetratricopeptide repeat protein [Candidatus Scalindua sp.]|jgi:tetratricopeptide (TPR) repeat protein|nr:tetratricopeptide repeat protein [Candidatus Scalindua sp.]
MNHIIPVSLLTLFGLFILWPITRKPLSEDEGNWYYHAIFYKKLQRSENFGVTKVNLCLEYIATFFFKLLPHRKLSSIQYFKILWYTSTALSVYLLAFVLWGNVMLSFIAGLIFLVTVAIPNNFFSITYAEHFFILPANLSITCAYVGVTQNSVQLIFISGILAAWMHHLKMPTILLSIILPLMFFMSKSLLLFCTWYASGFLLLIAISLALNGLHGNKHIKTYLLYLTCTYVITLSHIAKNKNWTFVGLQLKKLSKFLVISDQGTAYVERSLSVHKNLKQIWLDIKANTLPFCKDLYLILVLATLSIIWTIANFDCRVLILSGLFVTFVAMVYVQKNFYTPHFSPIWSPLSILAAKAIWDFWPSHSTNRTLGWAMIVFIGFGTYKIVRIIIKTFSRSETNSFGHLDPLFGKLYRLCEKVGKYIQDNSNENEKLFVWGDQPTIYLYSKREIFDMNHIFIYAHNKKIVDEIKLLNNLRNKPPELLIFYNSKVIDSWNIKRLQESIGIPYNHLKSFKIADDRHKSSKNPQGICFNFPLYRRNDKIYREILIDRAINAEVNNDINQARKHLKKALEFSPDSFEASFRLARLDDVDSRKMQRNYIESRKEQTSDPVNNSILLRLLSEINTEEANFDSSMENLEKALALNPDDFRIYNALGELYFSMGKIEDASKSFNRAIGLNAYSVDTYNNIGVILSQEGKRHDAAKCFQKALLIMPDHQDAHKNMEDLRAV